MAGHSKWANIQYRKGKQDAARSKLFSKLAKEITVAARLGDPDPDKNARLRLAIKEARLNSASRELIERAIKKATGADAAQYEEVRYEGYGPAGIALIVEAMTDNRNRTTANVRSYFTKYGGNLGENGSVAFLFDRLGEISYPLSVGDADTVMMAALDAGAADLESDDEGHWITCADIDFGEVTARLEAALGESATAKLVWRPQARTELDAEVAGKLIKLLDALEDDDDVQDVTGNFDISESVAAGL